MDVKSWVFASRDALDRLTDRFVSITRANNDGYLHAFLLSRVRSYRRVFPHIALAVSANRTVVSGTSSRVAFTHSTPCMKE